MGGFKMQHTYRLGIGGRLFLALVLISSITIIASGMSTKTFLDLRNQLHLLEQEDITGLDAAARLNDKSRLIVATAPILVTAESNLLRHQAMLKLNNAMANMDLLMRNLPDYDNYFRELIAQINNNLILLNQSVEHREQLHQQLREALKNIDPLFIQIISQLQQLPKWSAEQSKLMVINQLYYFAGLIEKIANAPSFNDLDDTFLRLEDVGKQVTLHLAHGPKRIDNALNRKIATLLNYGSRKGGLFALQNEQLELAYQQGFFLQNALQNIHQLAAQINLYTDTTNQRISHSLKRAIISINRNMTSVLLLSLISLIAACAISWFYVRRNVLQRILELQQNMRSIASAKLDTQIRIIGNDEISSMAADLKHFQRTAIAVERTNLALAAQIEERLIAEQQLQLTQNELIQAAKLADLGQLSVSITHEINQPLTAVISHLHSAGLHLHNGKLDAVKHSHAKITYLIDKVGVITRHLKSFARKAATELSAVELQPVISGAIDLMSNQFHEQQCQLIYHASYSPPAVLAESIRLEQVLINLLSNALDAVQNTSQPQISISVTVRHAELWIEVRDNGVGISTSQLDYIFDPFYTNRNSGDGLGLGLSISYNIVQDFGGQLKVTSAPSKGSCFSVILKLAEAA
jgi:phosphoglycerate-specific signal transduction histidine kinase